MKILITHPGKIGDCFWALPTARAIAEAYGERVDFMSSADFTSHLSLIQGQPYIGRAGYCHEWRVQNTAPMSPHTPPPRGKYVSFTSHRGVPEGLEFGEVPVEVEQDYDKVYHLGYPAWPTRGLAEYVFEQAQRQQIQQLGEDKERALQVLDLGRPWIEAPPEGTDSLPFEDGDVAVGFTDEWIELKVGILLALSSRRERDLGILYAFGSRWEKEYEAALNSVPGLYPSPADWLSTACAIARSSVFLGCLSSQAVLACALGKPRVLVEPNPHRHHEIFQHPDQPLVLGGDGKPTFDARHVADALREKLREAPRAQ